MDLYGPLAAAIDGAHPDLHVWGLTGTPGKLPAVRLEATDWTYPEPGARVLETAVIVAVMVEPGEQNLQRLDEVYTPAVFDALKDAGFQLGRQVRLRASMTADPALGGIHYARLFTITTPVTT